MNLEIYRKIGLSQVPRILSLMDRDPDSPTYGCLDRYYWHYASIDYPNVRWQEGMMLLAFIFQNDFEGNIWYGNGKVKDWLVAAIRFWEIQQARAGYFSENYPRERSFVGTSFSVYAATEASLITGIEIEPNILIRAGKWLSKNRNLHVANQMAGGAAALANIYTITNDKFHLNAAISKVAELLVLQENDGYFIEYGGYDIGYLTICLSYAAKYLRRIEDDNLANAAKKAFEFLESKIDDNCLFDYEKTSRGTQYLYPNGFVYFKRKELLAKHQRALQENRILNPAWMDDRFCLPLTIEYLESYLLEMNENAHDNH